MKRASNFLTLHVIMSLYFNLAYTSSDDIVIPFEPSKSIPSRDGASFVIGSAQENQNEKNLSLYNAAFEQKIVGINPEKAMVDNEEDKENPLYNKQIKFLTILPDNNNLAIITEQEPTSLYTLNSVGNNRHAVHSLKEIKDAAGNPSKEVVALECGRMSYTFAAVTGQNDEFFGQKDSGMAIIKMNSKKLENNAAAFFLEQIDPFKKPDDETQNIRAYPIKLSSPCLAFNHDIACLEKITDMYWSETLQLLFVAFQAQAGSQENAGVCSVAVGFLSDSNNFILTPIVSSANVFTPNAQNEIIGAVAPNAKVSIHSVRTMFTSTHLDYLIVVGGNGDGHTTRNKVFALPLLNHREKQPYRGRLASITKGIDLGNNPPQYHYAALRAFNELASTPDEIYHDNDQQVRVGNGPLLAGEINKIVIIEDTVFASVEKAYEGQQAGIYSSQALFDAQGTICAWSEWQPVARITDPIINFSITNPQNTISWITRNQEAKPVIKQISLFNAWKNRTFFAKTMTQIFQPEGGISQLLDINVKNPALKAPLLVGLGGKTLTVATNESSVKNEPTHQIVECAENVIHQDILFDVPTIAVFKGNMLSDIKIATTAQIATDGINGWLFVGGLSGLAVLTDDQGNGWNIHDERAPRIKQGMSFKKIGSYKSVKKMIADDNYLYVLTDSSLSRIDLTTSNFATNAINQTIIATSSDFNGALFFDMVVSEKLALLATSNGLYRIGNDQDVKKINNTQQAHWTLINLPEMVLPITKLQSYSPDHYSQNISRLSGVIHVIGSYRGKNKSHLHRLALASTQDNPITDKTVSLISEVISWGEKSTFASYHSFKDLFVSDGAHYFSYPGTDTKKPTLMCGLQKSEPSPIELSSTDRVNCILRNSTTGSWLVAGTFGLIVYE